MLYCVVLCYTEYRYFVLHCIEMCCVVCYVEHHVILSYHNMYPIISYYIISLITSYYITSHHIHLSHNMKSYHLTISHHIYVTAYIICHPPYVPHTDIDSLDEAGLRTRVAQIAAEFVGRTKWENLRLSQSLKQVEAEVSSKYLTLMLKQRSG